MILINKIKHFCKNHPGRKAFLYLFLALILSEPIMVYYVVFEPGIYLSSKSRFVIPYAIFIFPILFLFLFIKEVNRFYDEDGEENDGEH